MPNRENQADIDARYRSEGRVHVNAKIIHAAPGGWFKPGNGKTEWFKDHEAGPQMVVVPPGQFLMGSPEDERRWVGYDGREEPVRLVTIDRPFSVSRAPITRGEFGAFIADTNHTMDRGAYVWSGKRRRLWLIKDWKFNKRIYWRSTGFHQDDDHPVVCVSWDDAKAYVTWLNANVQSNTYRLLSEAEWEYCCRANSTTAFNTGAAINRNQANFGLKNKATSSAFSFPPNGWGLYDMHGNIWEWVDDAWHENYSGCPPRDGSVWEGGDLELRGLRGGSWDRGDVHFRSADRGKGPHWLRNYIVGFRVAKTLSGCR
jgi:formylglycine-generating enzyme required for sulfatase activity